MSNESRLCIYCENFFFGGIAFKLEGQDWYGSDINLCICMNCHEKVKDMIDKYTL